ncbi:siderophore-interacting protein [Allopusillimonas ginsengisoli]|nr:siderophore-interacting protein [Allopusillimonas ginsengisoli]
MAHRKGFGQFSRLLLLMAVCVAAAPALAANPAPDASEAGMAILHKLQVAARTLDYSGIYTYQQGAAMQSSRIVHIVDGTGERERIELLDGDPREFIRHNDVTQCLIPEKKVVILEHKRGDRFPGLILGEGRQIPDYYDIKLGQAGYRIAGRECVMLELVPRDEHRYGYRLCSDTTTHLLLKAQVIGPGGVVDQISFNSLEIGSQVTPDGLNSSWNTKGWKVIESSMKPVDLAQDGWRIPFPPGYEPVMQVTRTMKRGKQVNQLVLTDGLAAVSVFIESHGSGKSPPFLNEAVSTGAMNIFRTRIGDHWLTTLGEVPAQTLREIAERTQYVPLAPQQ